jgi:hypothetical protein
MQVSFQLHTAPPTQLTLPVQRSSDARQRKTRLAKERCNRMNKAASTIIRYWRLKFKYATLSVLIRDLLKHNITLQYTRSLR